MGEFRLPKERHDSVTHYHRAKEDAEDDRNEHGVIAHARCGLDAELETA